MNDYQENNQSTTQENYQQNNQTEPSQQYAATQAPTRPIRQLTTDRGLIKTLLLSLITLGIYGIVVYTKLSDEINITASQYDGKKTMNYCLLFFLVGPITLGIGVIVWFHKISNRIGNELERRGIDYKFGAGSFWGWNLLGAFILVGPFVYLHKLLKAVNLINENYNNYG